MRQLTLLALLLLLGGGCSKSKPVPAGESKTATDAPPPDTTASDRTKLLNNLKATNQKVKKDSLGEISTWVDSDPEAVAGLLELLKDKTTTGPGKILPTQINSTREAAATALLWGGPKGEAALKEKGLAILKEGLSDPQPAVREHTVYTIGLLGPIARPLSPDVMKLCTSPDANIFGVSFDTLRSIGVTDATGYVALLNHENREIAKLAAEGMAGLQDIPAAAVPALVTALGSEESSIRLGAATGVGTAGSRAALAAPAVAEAIKKTYPVDFNPMIVYDPGSDLVFWRALVRIGSAAVGPTAELLTHKNPIVRAFAAETLGEIGTAAKPATEKLKETLKDMYGIVAIEAACTLLILGEGKEESLEVMKRAIDAPNSVALSAIAAIPRMGEAGKSLIPLALAKLESDNPNARYAAIGLVGTLPPAEATMHAAAVGKLATDMVEEIRRQAGMVLEKLGKAAAPAAEALGNALTQEPIESVRDQFVDALIAMGTGARPALPTLLPLAKEKSLSAHRRIRVISAISTADPASKDVLATLLACAADEDQTVRAAAASSLARLDPLPPEALGKLISLARTDPRTPPRLAAVRAMARAGTKVKGAKADLEAIAADTQADLALWAKVGLAAIQGDVTKASGVIHTALTDRKSSARAAGCEALLLVGPQMSDLPTLIKLLKDLDSGTREFAARCIGFLGSRAKESVTPLMQLLNDREGEVRIAASEALAEMGPAALPAVEKLKELRRDPLAQAAARKALERLGVADKK